MRPAAIAVLLAVAHLTWTAAQPGPTGDSDDNDETTAGPPNSNNTCNQEGGAFAMRGLASALPGAGGAAADFSVAEEPLTSLPAVSSQEAAGLMIADAEAAGSNHSRTAVCLRLIERLRSLRQQHRQQQEVWWQQQVREFAPLLRTVILDVLGADRAAAAVFDRAVPQDLTNSSWLQDALEVILEAEDELQRRSDDAGRRSDEAGQVESLTRLAELQRWRLPHQQLLEAATERLISAALGEDIRRLFAEAVASGRYGIASLVVDAAAADAEERLEESERQASGWERRRRELEEMPDRFGWATRFVPNVTTPTGILAAVFGGPLTVAAIATSSAASLQFEDLFGNRAASLIGEVLGGAARDDFESANRLSLHDKVETIRRAASAAVAKRKEAESVARRRADSLRLLKALQQFFGQLALRQRRRMSSASLDGEERLIAEAGAAGSNSSRAAVCRRLIERLRSLRLQQRQQRERSWLEQVRELVPMLTPLIRDVLSADRADALSRAVSQDLTRARLREAVEVILEAEEELQRRCDSAASHVDEQLQREFLERLDDLQGLRDSFRDLLGASTERMIGAALGEESNRVFAEAVSSGHYRIASLIAHAAAGEDESLGDGDPLWRLQFYPSKFAEANQQMTEAASQLEVHQANLGASESLPSEQESSRLWHKSPKSTPVENDQKTNGEFGCLDVNGMSIEWFIALKKNLGSSYGHMTSAGLRWMAPPVWGNDIGKEGPVLRTLEQAVSDHGMSTQLLLAYSDQPPNGVSVAGGHMKGVLVFGQNSGFWLIHSVPKFPDLEKRSLRLPTTRYAQSFICITVKGRLQLEKILQQLDFAAANVYYQRTSTIRRPPASTPLGKSFWKLSFKANIVHYAKSNAPGSDIYSHVAQTLGESVFAETWRPNLGATGAVSDVSRVDFGAGFSYSNGQDHSKWCVSTNRTGDGWVCVGDLNRASTQLARGGGALCIRSAEAQEVFCTAARDDSGESVCGSSSPSSSSSESEEEEEEKKKNKKKNKNKKKVGEKKRKQQNNEKPAKSNQGRWKLKEPFRNFPRNALSELGGKMWNRLRGGANSSLDAGLGAGAPGLGAGAAGLGAGLGAGAAGLGAGAAGLGAGAAGLGAGLGAGAAAVKNSQKKQEDGSNAQENGNKKQQDNNRNNRKDGGKKQEDGGKKQEDGGKKQEDGGKKQEDGGKKQEQDKKSNEKVEEKQEHDDGESSEMMDDKKRPEQDATTDGRNRSEKQSGDEANGQQDAQPARVSQPAAASTSEAAMMLEYEAEVQVEPPEGRDRSCCCWCCWCCSWCCSRCCRRC